MKRGREAQLIDILYGPVVKETDLRYTPRATVEALFESDPPPIGSRGPWPNACVLDPCAGDGAILRVAKAHGREVYAVEIREEELERLEAICEHSHVAIGDWLQICHEPWNVEAIITNPPFSIAVEIALACFEVDPFYLALLLRCNTLGSNTWRAFWTAHPPTRIRPVKRPPFPKPGEDKAEGTDASEYAWFIWAAHEKPINLRPI